VSWFVLRTSFCKQRLVSATETTTVLIVSIYAGGHLCHRDWKQRQHHHPWQVPKGEEPQFKGEDRFVSVMLRCKLDDPVMGLM
jgi:hypothetical protein